ncbi:integrase catalytic domain-containing protein [Trichonephila inaurata madagascariensis]|uniref:Integrase catalytic domain-containing protein n=1 Tax=Trichonephila inaurata madagascariensis TaxID=2747483 RepID=A0A8X6YYR7_9ARAC|nr:integrase catalytic domain-containing protein [Trichonephila inaurata madagascariensis]
MPSECWPLDNVCFDINEIEAERRKTKLSSVNLSEDTAPWYASGFSDYDKIINVVAWTLCFINSSGPLFLRNSSKVWIVLFTCDVYPAVHLELVASLSTDSFLMAFRRFMARRGRSRTVYLDNGTNFSGSNNELSELDWEKITREANLHRILCKFNPPTASWWGDFGNGWFEFSKNC